MDGSGSGFSYSMVKSGPDGTPDEVEGAHVSAIEVMILWGSTVLHVSHLTPPRSFYVGEEFSDKSGCDYFIPSETLGTTRAPIVVSRGIGASLVILPRSRGYVDIQGQGKVSLVDLISTGRARPSSEMRGDDSEDIDRDQILMMQKLLNAAADREQEERKDQEVTEVAPDQKEGGTGTRAKGEEGSMGNPNTKDSGHKYGVQGPKDNADPHLAKQAALQEAAQFGMIGLISTMGGGAPNAPTAPWGREESLGQDEKSARGNMFGDTIGDSFGAGGLGLSGVGERGGGRGEGKSVERGGGRIIRWA